MWKAKSSSSMGFILTITKEYYRNVAQYSLVFFALEVKIMQSSSLNSS